MHRFVIEKSPPLTGDVAVAPAKNAILPQLAACLLTEDEMVMHSLPGIDDVATMLRIMRALGCRVCRQNGATLITSRSIDTQAAPYDLARCLRASILFLGAMLARTGRARLSLPGGCAIGTRPVDLHVRAFEAMGARVNVGYGVIEAEASSGLHGAQVVLDVPSVGATENIIMAASLAQGTTRIINAAKEPEIVDLALMLRRMGAKIMGDGTDMVTIEGVSRLSGVEHEAIPDRIEAGTLMIASMGTDGNILLRGARGDHLRALTQRLRDMGGVITEYPTGMRVRGRAERAVDIKTSVYPGFPTDLQPQIMPLMCVAQGTSVIYESIFENRFMHVPELRRMGAHIHVEDRAAVIEGVTHLTGARVRATDLRAGAALVIASLIADGETIVEEAEHIDRGYDRIEEKLTALGAVIRREEVYQAAKAGNA